MELLIAYSCVFCLYAICFLRAFLASTLRERLGKAVTTQCYIFLQNWLPCAAILCQAPCIEGLVLLLCSFVPATFWSILFKAIASMFWVTPTFSMLVPVFWILVWIVILTWWPALYFHHVWTVQDLFHKKAPNYVERKLDD